MARIRTIKPDFMDSGSTKALTREARLFFLQLLTEADDYGRFIYSPKRLAGVLYPDDDDVTRGHIDAWMSECEREGMVRRYSAAATETLVEATTRVQTYGCIVNWKKHQRVANPTDSKLPEPPPEPIAGPPDPPPEGTKAQVDANSVKPHEKFISASVAATENPRLEREQGTGNREVEKESSSSGTGAEDEDLQELKRAACSFIAEWRTDARWNDLVRDDPGFAESRFRQERYHQRVTEDCLANYDSRIDALLPTRPHWEPVKLAEALVAPAVGTKTRVPCEHCEARGLLWPEWDPTASTDADTPSRCPECKGLGTKPKEGAA